jgi:hypothetical protein
MKKKKLIFYSKTKNPKGIKNEKKKQEEEEEEAHLLMWTALCSPQ